MPKQEKNRNKTTFTIEMTEDKIAAIDYSLRRTGRTLESEVQKFCESLYCKKVPAALRNFLDSMHAPKPEKHQSLLDDSEISEPPTEEISEDFGQENSNY